VLPKFGHRGSMVSIEIHTEIQVFIEPLFSLAKKMAYIGV
jgi:hypothetical protein